MYYLKYLPASFSDFLTIRSPSKDQDCVFAIWLYENETLFLTYFYGIKSRLSKKKKKKTRSTVKRIRILRGSRYCIQLLSQFQIITYLPSQ